MKAKTTEWFGPEIKPTRIGVYETSDTDHTRGGLYQYWTGKRWATFNFTPFQAYQDRRYKSNYQNRQWRGLAKVPK